MRTIHLYLPESDHWCRSILPGIARFVRQQPGVRLGHHYETAFETAARVGDLSSEAFVGTLHAGLVKAFRSRGVKPALVNVSANVIDVPAATVTHDNVAIGRLAAEHLHGLGERSYYFIGMGRKDVSEQRRKGFVEAIEAAGGKITEIKDLDEATFVIKPPAAAFCAADIRARALAQRLEKKGWRIPQDVAILGVDNDPYQCDLTHIPLSSIDLLFEAVGYRAAQVAVQMLEGEADSQLYEVISPSHVEIRQSTDLFETSDPLVRRAIYLIREPSDGRLTVRELSAKLGVSVRSLQLRFQRETGSTVQEALHQHRMQRSQQLVDETMLPLGEIARRIGFADPSRFSAQFRRSFGSLPSERRRMINPQKLQ